MSREAERAAIMAHFQTIWSSQYPTIAVAWPNHEFETPANSEFVVFSLVDRGTTRETLGRTYMKRHRGTLQLDIYVPVGLGVKKAREISDYLETQMDSLDLSMGGGVIIMFRTPSSREVSGNEMRASNLEDNWHRYIVECPYDRQEIVVR